MRPLPGNVDGRRVEDETGPCNGVKGAVDAYDPPLEARVPRLDRCCLKQKVGYSRDTAPKNQYSTPPLLGEQSEIVNFLLWMQREGYSPSTIMNVRKIVVRLNKLGTLLDGDAVKLYVARLEVRGGTKLTIFKAYATFARWKGFAFDIPRVRDTEPVLPFIPLESELDSLISGSSRKLSTLLLLLKETGCRIGEILRLEWTDLDLEAGTANVRAEKGSRNRQARLSQRLQAMMMRLPKKNKLVFSGTKTGTLINHLAILRKRLASKLENPRLLRIHFHTFRHWYATKTYHKTKDLLFTQRVLGHRSLNSTLRYTQLVNWENEDEFICKTAKSLPEATSLIEAGFEYVTEMDGVKLLKKRK